MNLNLVNPRVRRTLCRHCGHNTLGPDKFECSANRKRLYCRTCYRYSDAKGRPINPVMKQLAR